MRLKITLFNKSSDAHTSGQDYLDIKELVSYILTEKFLPAGEMILEITNGKGINGNINGCRIRNSSATGAAGKETDIGKNRIPGVCRDCLPEISREMSGLASLNKAPSKVDKDIIVRKKEGRKDMIEDRAA
ncbi:MAG TPA: hypothetical protein DDX93_01690 [Smithella sp.]|jgi:hypothetical protein|nr:hypothetical protein [Smithella sp.]